MFKDAEVFSGFSVKDIAEAKQFYGETLGLSLHDLGDMGFMLHFASGGQHFVYPKPDHQPATFTVLNFRVADINATVDELVAKGITLERYEGMPMPQDEKGIARGIQAGMGPDIGWFKDPSGNILAVLQEA